MVMTNDGMIFFFNDTATTEIYTLSLHDALPICAEMAMRDVGMQVTPGVGVAAAAEHYRSTAAPLAPRAADRKSTRLNSSHLVISYAVFCLKKKIRATAMPTPSTITTAMSPYEGL